MKKLFEIKIVDEEDPREKKQQAIYQHQANPKKDRKYVMLLTVLLLLFFTSKLYIPDRLSGESGATLLNEKYSFSTNRNFTFLSNTFDKDKRMLEVMIGYENNNSDGIEDYYYALDGKGFNLSKTTINVVYKDPFCQVIQITGLKKYKELYLYFAPKLADAERITDYDTGTIIINRYNTNDGMIDANKKDSDFQIQRYDIIISDYEIKLNSTITKRDDYKKQIQTIETEIIKLEAELENMTSIDRTESEEKVKLSRESLSELRQKLSDCEADVLQYQDIISELEQKKAAL